MWNETSYHQPVRAYLSDALSFLDLEDAIVVHGWDDHDADMATLTCSIVDYRDGRLSEDTFRAELARWLLNGRSSATWATSTATTAIL